jgi:hypothetical protein
MKWFPKIEPRHIPMIVWLVLGPPTFYVLVESHDRRAVLGLFPLILSWFWCVWFAAENKKD